MDLLTFTNKGIYCPVADVYIDPFKKVKTALITHGHADHARWGNQQYWCSDRAKPVIQYRLGPTASVQSRPYRTSFDIKGVEFSFHPAGHIIGSAQIRVAYKGEVWVVSGDYKLYDDGVCMPFEPLNCDVFVTESTFARPIYQWPNPVEVHQNINQWWANNQKNNTLSILTTYSLGKAQRLLKHLDPSIGPIFVHAAIDNVHKILKKQGISFPNATRVSSRIDKSQYRGGIILAPPSAIKNSWANKFKKYTVSIGVASGWMVHPDWLVKRGGDVAFILSDHADWNELNQAVQQSKAPQIYTMHGFSTDFATHLNQQGLAATPVKVDLAGKL